MWKTNRKTGKKFNAKGRGIDSGTKKSLDAQDKARQSIGVEWKPTRTYDPTPGADMIPIEGYHTVMNGYDMLVFRKAPFGWVFHIDDIETGMGNYNTWVEGHGFNSSEQARVEAERAVNSRRATGSIERCPLCSKRVSGAELEQNGYRCYECAHPNER